ncbi:MAG: DUF58 domain-containing protein [Alphaproteobacteria bacterium]|nr:DUF58 domain-containing protein [Alphaproteobacteria bacterium]
MLSKLYSKAEEQADALSSVLFKARQHADHIISGGHASKKSGMGENFWQFKEYSPGDRLQDIDWRQSAKTDHVFIRQKEWQKAQKNFFWSASYKGMDYKSKHAQYSKREAASILLLSLAFGMVNADEQIGLYSQSRTGRGDNAVLRLGEHFLSDKDDLKLPDTRSFVPPRGSTLIAAGDFLSDLDEIAHSLNELKSRIDNGLIIQILDPDEIELDFSGRIKFENFDHSDSELINHIPSVRTEYKVRIESHIAEIKALCIKNDWSYILHRTDADISSTLQTIKTLIELKE